MNFLALVLFVAVPASASLTAEDFSVYSLGSIRYSHSDFEGRTGAAGDVRFDNFSLGAKLARGESALIVGGSADLSDGRVLHGGVRAGGRVRTARVELRGAAVERSGDGGELAAVSRELLADADLLASLPEDGTESWDGGLLLTARPGVVRTVIRLTAARLAEARRAILRVPAGAALVVDVTGASASLSNVEFLREGEGSVVFNFASARTLIIEGAAVPGVVLAPRAATRFVSGRVDGRLYVGGLDGDGQVNVSAAPGLTTALSGSGGTVVPPPSRPTPGALPRAVLPGACDGDCFDGSVTR